MIRVRVPASTSNLGAGYDTFGLALELFLSVTAMPSDDLEISYRGENPESVPLDETNLIYKSISSLYEKRGLLTPALRLKIENPIPPGRGLGSSGAAIIAGLLIGNQLLGEPFSRDEILNIAIDFEGHPENVSASLLGGLTLAVKLDREHHIKRISVPQSLSGVLLIPELYISTEEARKLLPENIPHSDAVFNLQRTALLSYAFLTEDFSVLRHAVQDKLHQPYRKQLQPAYDAFEKAGYENGALGISVSGSGSAIIAFADSESVELVKTWQQIAKKEGISAKVLAIEFCSNAAKVE